MAKFISSFSTVTINVFSAWIVSSIISNWFYTNKRVNGWHKGGNGDVGYGKCSM